MTFDIEYEKEIDFEHCNEINDAAKKLSVLTNLLNRIISVRHSAKASIILLCSDFPEEKLHKLSWDNKLVCLQSVSKDPLVYEVIKTYNDADQAYVKVKNKQAQVYEDIMRLKKIIEVTPR